MFDPLFDVVTAILAWFYSLVPSYGMAIALLTLTGRSGGDAAHVEDDAEHAADAAAYAGVEEAPEPAQG